MHILSHTRNRVFAGLVAFGPRVVKVRVATISTLAHPSTARSATIKFAGFLESTALGASNSNVYIRANLQRNQYHRTHHHLTCNQVQVYTGCMQVRSAGAPCQRAWSACVQAFYSPLFPLCVVLTRCTALF